MCAVCLQFRVGEVTAVYSTELQRGKLIKPSDDEIHNKPEAVGAHLMIHNKPEPEKGGASHTRTFHASFIAYLRDGNERGGLLPSWTVQFAGLFCSLILMILDFCVSLAVSGHVQAPAQPAPGRDAGAGHHAGDLWRCHGGLCAVRAGRTAHPADACRGPRQAHQAQVQISLGCFEGVKTCAPMGVR